MDNSQVLKTSRAVMLISYFILLGLLTLNPFIQDAPVVFYLWLAPLAIFIPGVLKGHARSLLWMCFVVLLYFYVAVDNIALRWPAPSSLDLAELATTVLLFSACSVWLRCRQNIPLSSNKSYED